MQVVAVAQVLTQQAALADLVAVARVLVVRLTAQQEQQILAAAVVALVS
jgi:hypothetical protein